MLGPAGFAKIARGSTRLPSRYAARCALRTDIERQLTTTWREPPRQHSQRLTASREPRNGAQRADEPLDIVQTVPLVRHVEHALGRRELVPIKLQGIERPVPVVRAQQNQLRPRELLAITIRVDHLQ